MSRASIKELTGILNLSDKAVRDHLARGQIEKGDDGKYDVDEVRAYVAARQETDNRNQTGAAKTAKEIKLALECKILNLRFRKLEETVIERAEHDAILANIGAEVRQRMEMIPGSIAPLLVGKSVAVIADILSRAVRDALTAIADGGKRGE